MSADTLTPIWDNHRRDLEVADSDLVDPTVTDALVQGEWVSLNTTGKAVRAANQSNRAFMVWTEKGDYSAQALDKIAVLWYRDYEVETDIYDNQTYAVGDPVTVRQVTVDGVTRAALTNDTILTTEYIYGVVTKIPSAVGEPLRVKLQAPVLNT